MLVNYFGAEINTDWSPRATDNNQTMTKLIGAVCSIVALFSVGVLQPIECRENERLFNELDNEALQLAEVEYLLDAADIELGGIRLSRLMNMRSISEPHCGLEDLRQDSDLTYVYWSSKENKGLFTYTEHYFQERIRFCFDKLVKSIETDVNGLLSANDRQVLEEFWGEFNEKESDLFKSMNSLGECSEDLNSVIGSWKLKSTGEKLSKLESSCKNLNAIVKEHFTHITWGYYKTWFYSETVPLGWIKIQVVCTAYLALLKPSTHLVDDEMRHEDFVVDYVGYGLGLLREDLRPTPRPQNFWWS